MNEFTTTTFINYKNIFKNFNVAKHPKALHSSITKVMMMCKGIAKNVKLWSFVKRGGEISEGYFLSFQLVGSLQ